MEVGDKVLMVGVSDGPNISDSELEDVLNRFLYKRPMTVLHISPYEPYPVAVEESDTVSFKEEELIVLPEIVGDIVVKDWGIAHTINNKTYYLSFTVENDDRYIGFIAIENGVIKEGDTWQDIA